MVVKKHLGLSCLAGLVLLASPAQVVADRVGLQPLNVAPITVSDLRHAATVAPAQPRASGSSAVLATELPAAYAACTRIAYQSWVDGNWELMLVAGDGSAPQRLTNLAQQDESPSLARGCSLLAFGSDRGGNDDIFAMWLDGSHLQQLTSDSADDVLPAISPDGTQIAFQSYRNGTTPEIYIMAVAGGTQTRLTWNGSYDGQPRWSPDGSQILFISDRSGAKNVWVMTATGMSARQVTSLPHAGGATWSPDGSQIAFASDDNGTGFTALWLVNADGTNPRRIYRPTQANTDAWPDGWSYDGQYVLYEQAQWTYDNGWDMTASSLNIIAAANPTDRRTLVAAGTNMAGSWSLCDVQAPTSWMEQLPATSTSPLTVAWGGSDGCAVPLEYQVQVRIGATGAWTDWQVTPGALWTTTTQAVYTADSVGITVYFRVRARDAVGNREAWRTTQGDTYTVIPIQLAGTVRDATGLALSGANVRSLVPLGYETQSDAQGRYVLQASGDNKMVLRASLAGHTVTDLRVPLGDTTPDIDIVMLPRYEYLLNGSFESEGVAWYWARGTEVVTTTYAYGQRVARLGYVGPATSQHVTRYPQDTRLWQDVTIPAGAQRPTLSLLYALAPGEETGCGLLTVEIIDGSKVSQLLQTDQPTAWRQTGLGGQAPLWQLLSSDLSAWIGRAVRLQVAYDHRWGTGYALVDRVSLGPWLTPSLTAVAPGAIQPAFPATLTISGSNFHAQAEGEALSLYAGHWPLTVRTVASDRIVAGTGSLPPGRYDLRVVNPGGATATLAGSLQVRDSLVIPLVLGPSRTH